MKAKVCKIFISSPGDVSEERNRAKDVIQRLQRRYTNRLILKPILWEDLPLVASASFQSGIDERIRSEENFTEGVQQLVTEEGGIDIAVFILWSRLGTPLGPELVRPDGRPYRSGTEREFELMMDAYKKSNFTRPQILFYQRIDDIRFEHEQRQHEEKEQKERQRQKNLAETFVKEEFYDAETGSNTRACHTFGNPPRFSEILRKHLQDLLDQIAGVSLSHVVWDVNERGSPFRGIEPFGTKHQQVFFGREDEEVEIIQALRKKEVDGCPCVIIWGASGSGKSSLARAGVVPTICGDLGKNWRYIDFTPSELGKHPIEALIDLLEAHTILELKGDTKLRSAIRELMTEDPLSAAFTYILPGIERALGKKDGMLLILADQMEEIFTSGDLSDDTREQFLSLLEAMARTRAVWIIGTMRSDFYPAAQTSPSMRRLRGRHGDFDLITPDPSAIQRMVEDPVEISNLAWEIVDEKPLSALLRKEIRGDGNLLPLLEFLLEELYRDRSENNTLRYSTYYRLGGIQGALNKKAEEILESMPSEIRHRIYVIFQRIASVDSKDHLGFVRRWANYDELCADPGTKQLVDTFLSKEVRLFIAKNDAGDSNQKVVSIAHEALFKSWSTLKNWLEEHRQQMKARTSLSEDTKRWLYLNKSQDCLYRKGTLLDEALNLMQLGFLESAEEAFVIQSESEAARETIKNGLSQGEASINTIQEIHKSHPQIWKEVVAESLASPNKSIKKHTIRALEHFAPGNFSEALIQIVLSKESMEIAFCAAQSIIRRNDSTAFDYLWQKCTSAETSRSQDKEVKHALGMLKAACDLEREKPRFLEQLDTLEPKQRLSAKYQSWIVRLYRALPAFPLLVIPAMIFAVLGAAIGKTIPATLNYSGVQSDGSLITGLFHSAPAGILIGGGSVFGLCIYRLIFGREYETVTLFKPIGSIIWGGLMGLLAGFFCIFLVSGVGVSDALYVMGWVDTPEKPPILSILNQVFLEEKKGFVFPLTSLGTGLSLALLTNLVRRSDRWKHFLSNQSSVKNLSQIGDILKNIFRITVVYSWIVFASVFGMGILGYLIVINTSEVHVYDEISVSEILLGGILPIDSETIDSEQSHETEKQQDMKSHVLPEGKGIVGYDRQAIANWKRSHPGILFGIIGDCIPKALGSYLSIIGMGFGIVLLRYGVVVEPGKT